MRTLSEIDTTVKIASKDMGFSWGIEEAIGKNIRLILMQALYKPANDGGEINWHQDDFYFRVNKTDAVTSCWITLDKATTQNGCMWVIPKAHNKLLKHKPLYCTKPDKDGYLDWSNQERYWGNRERLIYFLPLIIYTFKEILFMLMM